MTEKDRQLAEERFQVRKRLFDELTSLGIDTNEAREAIDLAMDVASAFDSRDKLYELSCAWNTWTFNECAAMVERNLDSDKLKEN
jgi:hypothetical protein